MSNAVVVTQAVFGEGLPHCTPPLNRRAFVTLWPFRLYGNKFVWFVPPLLFRVLLFHMEKPINAREATLSGRVAVLRARLIWPGPPLGPLSILVKAWRMLTHVEVQLDPQQMEGTSGMGWKNPAQARAQTPMQRSNKWVSGLSVHSFSPNLFGWRGFYEAQQPWRMSLNNGTSTQRPLLTDVYCMGAWVQGEPLRKPVEQKGEDIFSAPTI